MIYITKDKNITEIDYQEPVTIYARGKVDQEMVKSFDEGFVKAHETGQPYIPVVIDSFGGLVYCCLSIYETIKSAEVPVITFAKGKAMSCGLAILSFGTPGYRYMSPHAFGMFHQISTGKSYNKISEVEISVEQSKRLQEKYFTEMARSCGKTDRYFLDLIKKNNNLNYYMDPDEVKSHNIVDHIGSPKLKAEIEFNWKLTE